MKPLKFVSFLLISIALFTACINEQTKKEESAGNEQNTGVIKSNASNFSDYKIYLVKGNTENLLSLEDFKDYVRSQMDIDASTEVDNVEISIGTENHDAVLATVPEVGQFAVFIEQRPNSDGYELSSASKTCTCVGADCKSGCRLTITDSNCSCTECSNSGSCVKTEEAEVEI